MSPDTFSAVVQVNLSAARAAAASQLSALRGRDVRDLAIRVVNHKCRWFHFAWPKALGPNAQAECELQLLVLPGDGKFADEQACRVVVLPDDAEAPQGTVSEADFIVRLPQTPKTPEDLHQAVRLALRHAA